MVKFDLSTIKDTGDEDGKVGLEFGNTPQAVHGVRKAVQQWLVAFLTMQGTVAGDSSYGSTFLEQIKSVSLGDSIRIAQAFRSANNEVLSWLQNNKTVQDIQNDEVVVSASLDNITVTPDARLQLTVALTVNSGAQRVVAASVTKISE